MSGQKPQLVITLKFETDATNLEEAEEYAHSFLYALEHFMKVNADSSVMDIVDTTIDATEYED